MPNPGNAGPGGVVAERRAIVVYTRRGQRRGKVAFELALSAPLDKDKAPDVAKAAPALIKSIKILKAFWLFYHT